MKKKRGKKKGSTVAKKNNHKKKGSPIIAILIIVFSLIVVAGAGYYAYTYTNLFHNQNSGCTVSSGFSCSSFTITQSSSNKSINEYSLILKESSSLSTISTGNSISSDTNNTQNISEISVQNSKTSVPGCSNIYVDNNYSKEHPGEVKVILQCSKNTTSIKGNIALEFKLGNVTKNATIEIDSNEIQKPFSGITNNLKTITNKKSNPNSNQKNSSSSGTQITGSSTSSSTNSTTNTNSTSSTTNSTSTNTTNSTASAGGGGGGSSGGSSGSSGGSSGGSSNSSNDTTPPSVSFISPTDGSNVSGSITVNVSSKDNNSGVAYTALYISSTMVGNDTGVSTPYYTFSLNTSSYSNGYYNLTAKSKDKKGNLNTTKVKVGIDNSAASNSSNSSSSTYWITAYYAGYSQGSGGGGNNAGYLPAEDVNYTNLTNVIQFSVKPDSNGSLNWASNSLNSVNRNATVTDGHNGGSKVLFSVGGWNTEPQFLAATNSTNLNTFVNNIVSFMQSNNYDGVDIDWETLSASSATNYENFITALRTKMNQTAPGSILTIAAQWEPSIIDTVKGDINEINLMTYDMSGAYSGWVTWHDSPIYTGGCTFPSGSAVPSINATVATWEAAGIPASKLGVGTNLYGYVWSGGSGTTTGGASMPCQNWTQAPSLQKDVAYYKLMNTYAGDPATWDNGAQVPYISINKPGNASDKFISYSDTYSEYNKAKFVKDKGLGGIMLFELGGSYLNDSSGQKEPLLQAVKDGLLTNNTLPTNITLEVTPLVVDTSKNVTISAWAINSNGINTTKIYVDGVLSNTCSATTCNTTVGPFSAGTTHTYYSTATDGLGGVATSSTYNFTVQSVDVTPPSVSFISPTNGANISNVENVSVSSNDSQTGVAYTAFYINGTMVGNDTGVSTPYYNFSVDTWNYNNGYYNFTVQTADKDNNVNSTSIIVRITNQIPSTLTLYSDSLNSNWTDASYNGVVDYSNTNPVYTGTYSISFNATSQWGGIMIDRSPNFNNTVAYAGIDFYIKGTSAENVYLIQSGSAPTGSSSKIPINTTWQHIFVNMTKIDPSYGSIASIKIETDTAGDPYYVDNWTMRPR